MSKSLSQPSLNGKKKSNKVSSVPVKSAQANKPTQTVTTTTTVVTTYSTTEVITKGDPRYRGAGSGEPDEEHN